ncbi:galactose oxidase [Mucilaginibacter jinjuensis]|uniref:Galactose oxidase n=1 Tax=Mucilaginibacter jinjuensis TaxID=1176721 RepID=A0ABY7T200_9SPHI|nr:galactose oxidase [Mucilaginibacter jinjuensis]WCT10426.1 galactose oxidase [Mucilaginibacter jinjuensis]
MNTIRLLLVLLLLNTCLVPESWGQSYGLGFFSHDTVPEKRTSLDLFPQNGLHIDNTIRISFEMSFLPDREDYYGYIFRLIENGKNNVDLIYNKRDPRPDEPGIDPNHFKLVMGDRYSNISFNISQTDLVNHWNKFTLTFNFAKDELTVMVNNNKYVEHNFHFKPNLYKLFFGVNNFSTFKTNDCPPFKLRDVKIEADNSAPYHWALNENQGNIAHEDHDKLQSEVVNPLWMYSLHAKWSHQKSLKINGAASVAFNPRTSELYIVGADSLITFSLKKYSLSAIGYNSGPLNLVKSNESSFNPYDSTLYNYYIENKQKEIIKFDFKTRRWNQKYSIADPAIDFWQSNNFFRSADNSLYILDGYGQFKYKNTINRYSFDTHQWEMVNAGGAHFSPRYLAATGTTNNGDIAYILGGYGSNSGLQALGPKNFYDLTKFDARTKTFTKLYDLKVKNEDWAFANSMIIDKDNKHFYTLIFPNHTYNSYLQLLIGSLDNPSFKVVNSKIPYDFSDTFSFANIYYSEEKKEFIAVTLLRTVENKTTVNIYTLLSPPELLISTPSVKSTSKLVYIVPLLVALLLSAIWFLLKRKPKAAVAEPVAEPTLAVVPSVSSHLAPIQEHATFEVTGNSSSLFLFGDLQLFTADGEEISKQFTSLLKELFLLILVYSLKYGRGVSPEKLIEILWFDKSEESAKNNRSANLSKLKNILQQSGGLQLSKTTGKWKVEIDPKLMYVDYYHFLQIAADRKNITKEKIDELINITQRGNFLANNEFSWLDEFKSEVANQIIDICLEYAGKLKQSEDPEFLIKLANCIFHFDSVNEDAMVIKCKSLAQIGKHSLAKSTFEHFNKEFKQLYGEEFNKEFHAIVE